MTSEITRLINRIAEELDIRRGTHESLTAWKARVVYSAVGHLASASLHDVQEERTNISIQHFKSRIEKLYSIWLAVLPELNDNGSISPENIADKIYSIMINSGCIYHSPDRITASAYTHAQSGQVLFLRGAPPGKSIFRSGLGAYLPTDNAESSHSLSSMFGLQRNTLAEYCTQLISRAKLTETFTSTAGLEFLRTAPPFTKGHFTSRPDTDGRISLMRSTESHIYYLYRFEDGKVFAQQLPRWQTANCEFRKISNSLINSTDRLPPAVFCVDGEIVYLSLHYLYPPQEMNFLQLYSWPSKYDFSNMFRYTLSLPVFSAVRTVFERIGYQFSEEVFHDK